MKFILEVNNKTDFKYPKIFYSNVFKHTLKLANMDCLKNETIELSVALVDEDEICVLNTRYRKKNSPTDVLSFCEYENTQELCEKKNTIECEAVFLGELILCPTYIKKNADEDGESMEYALTYIISHGILHLLGYEHGKKMFDLQKKVAQDLVK
jgi:probable rRNA maturation factor